MMPDNGLIKTLLETTSDLVLIIDAKNVIVASSQAAEAHFATNMVGQPASSFLAYPSIQWQENAVEHYRVLTGKVVDNASAAMQALMTEAAINVYWVDRDGVAQGCNQHVLDMLELNHAEYQESSYKEFAEHKNIPTWIAEKFEQDDQRVMQTGQVLVGEEEPAFLLPDGDRRYFLSHRVPMRNNQGEVCGAAGISIDISRLKLEKEQYEFSDKAKTVMLHHVVHDVCTPLTSMVQYIEQLVDKTSDEETKTELWMLLECTKQVSQLTRSVFQYLKTEDSHATSQERIFNLNKILQGIKVILTPCAKAKGLDFSIHCDEMPLFFMGDGDKIQRIILNLLANAVNYTSQGNVKLQVMLEETHLKLIISDTGCGIAAKNQSAVFEPYQRVNAEGVDAGCGLGLGLSIVKQFVDVLRGEIIMDSIENRGTTFTVTLPIELPPT